MSFLTYMNAFYVNNFNESKKLKYKGIGFGNNDDKTSSYHLAKILKAHKIDIFETNGEKFKYYVPINQKKSKLIKVGSTGTGEIKEVIPIMASKLNMFEPIKFPKTTSAFFLITATKVVANSGKDVPMATNVRPIIASLMP